MTDTTADKGLLVDLCRGPVGLPGCVDQDHRPPPFPDGPARVVVLLSAADYFSRRRAPEILKSVRRVQNPRLAAGSAHGLPG